MELRRYKERIGAKGFTKRERDVSYTRDFYRRRLPDSLSYKEVELEGKPTTLVIDKGTMPFYKKFRSYLEDQEILVGDYVKWADTHWLVVRADADHEIYIDGMLYQCNYLLQWQDETGKIIERWVHIANASSYNTGKEWYFQMEIGTNQLMVFMPIDEDTKKLERDKRVYCDYTNKNIRYKMLRVDSVSETYGKKGLLYIIMGEDLDHHTADNDELRICDYFEPGVIDGEDGEPTDVPNASIDYATTYLRVGDKPKAFSASFLIREGEEEPTAQWEVQSDYYITSEIDGNTIWLSCNDQNAVGSKVKLILTGADYEASLDLTIRAKY